MEQLVAACRLAADLAEASSDPARTREWQEPPHPTYRALMKRLRADALAEGWRFRPSRRSDGSLSGRPS